MNRALHLAWPRPHVSISMGWICAWLSRLLLLVAAIEVITMPLTQHLWTWDKFLHGGQDFELGMLMVVTCLCFVLLRAQHTRQGLRFLLCVGIFLRLRQHVGMLFMVFVSFFSLSLVPFRPPVPRPAAAPLPLLI